MKPLQVWLIESLGTFLALRYTEAAAERCADEFANRWLDVDVRPQVLFDN